MNNSFLSHEASFTPKVKTEEVKDKEAELMRKIEALKSVLEGEGWSSLKTLVFDPKEAELKQSIFNEARSENPDTHKLAKLNGRYEEVRRYAHLKDFANQLQTELNNLRKIYG